VAFVCLAAGVAPAAAAPIHFAFQAQYVDTFAVGNTAALPNPGGGLVPNQIVTGEFSYDLAAPGTPATTAMGYSADATITLNLALGPLTFNLTPVVDVISNPNNDINTLVFYMNVGYSNAVLQANNTTLSATLALLSDHDPFSSQALPAAFDIDDFRTATISIGALGPSTDQTGTGAITSYFNIIGITAQDAPAPAETPLPGALPLFAGGLAALGLIAHRKRRKVA